MVTATDLAQGNLKAERGRPAISSLVGDRHGHMDCRKMLSGPPDSAGQKWDVAARGHRQASDSSRSVFIIALERGLPGQRIRFLGG